MDKKKYTTPSVKVVNIQTCGMLATSPGETIGMPWSGGNPALGGPGEIDEFSTFDVF